MIETFKPIAVKDPTDNPWLFKLRCILDLQLATIARYLRPALSTIQGTVLDVGAGQSPWRGWLPQNIVYQGIDISNSKEFGMINDSKEMVYYDGTIMPFDNCSFDNVLCIEVLEHALDPEFLLSETARVLRKNGKIFLTVPWSARRHHIPYDFHRFTRERLINIFEANGFSHIEINERGSDISVIANKILLLNFRLLKPRLAISSFGNIVLGLCCLPITGIFIACAHLSEYWGWGSLEDPLGYFGRQKRQDRS